MKSVVLCALALALVAAAHIPEEDDVLVLNKSNLDEALEAHPNILVEF
ncbi:protein disulfide-isomerase isoform X1, partial [Tachysurus ichikawai]